TLNQPGGANNSVLPSIPPATQIRGELKTKAMPLVKNTYKFHLSSDKIKLNKQRYQELVNDKFYTCIGEVCKR
ncbi:hypothetical protein FRC02_005348, partial [Tulasnella sp. 418]